VVQAAIKPGPVLQLASAEYVGLVLPRQGLMPARRKGDEKLPAQLLA